jgi:hypothetical protein
MFPYEAMIRMGYSSERSNALLKIHVSVSRLLEGLLV